MNQEQNSNNVTENLTLQSVLNLLNNVPKKLEKEVAKAVYNAVQPIIADTLIEYQELFKFFTAVEEFKNEVGLDPVEEHRSELAPQEYVGEDDAEQTQGEQAFATQTEATASTEGDAQTEKVNDQQAQAQDGQVNNDASTTEAQEANEQAKTDPVQTNENENEVTQAQDQKRQTKLTDDVKANLDKLPKELIELYLAQANEQKKTA